MTIRRTYIPASPASPAIPVLPFPKRPHSSNVAVTAIRPTIAELQRTTVYAPETKPILSIRTDNQMASPVPPHMAHSYASPSSMRSRPLQHHHVLAHNATAAAYWKSTALLQLPTPPAFFPSRHRNIAVRRSSVPAIARMRRTVAVCQLLVWYSRTSWRKSIP